ncbi:MAG: DUF3021 domain-containing protein [Acutalibacteraceae bacterium]|nr:DUF3021 domain-containing protein [Acutalibacteraceae bacterium]
MNKHLKNFLQRGSTFGGLGPIVAGIVYAIIEACGVDIALTGSEICIAIISSYILAFVQAGASVFNEIDEWPLPKSLLCHFSSIYVTYSLCYIVNKWIPFEPMVLIIFTAIFVIIYFIIWTSVYVSVKSTSKKLNSKLG